MKLSITKVANFLGHTNSIYHILKKDTTHFYSAGADGMIVLWDINQPNEGTLIAKINQPIYCLLQWNNLLIAGVRDGHLHIIDLEKEEEINKYEIDKQAIFALKLTNNTLIVATGSGKVLLLNKNFEILKQQQISIKSIRSIAANETNLFFGASDNNIYITNHELAKTHTIQEHEGSVFALTCTKTQLISGSKDARIKLFDTQNYNLMKTIDAHWFHVKSLSYNPENGLLLSTSMDKTIKIWNVQTMVLLKVIDQEKYGGHTSSVNCGLWIDEKILISCSDDRSIMAFKIEE